MKNYQFSIAKSIYLIIIFIFIFGLFLEVTQTDYILKHYQYKVPANQTQKAVKRIDIPEEVLTDLTPKPFLLIYETNNQESIDIKNNIAQTLKYMKQEIVEVTMENIPQTLSDYKMVVVTFEDIDKIQDINNIVAYVSEGGHCFFAIRPDIDAAFYKIYRKLGIFEVGGFIETTGLELTSNVLIHQKGLQIDEDFVSNSSLTVSLEKKSQVLMKVRNGNLPLLWETPHDHGKFMVFNGTMLRTKENRGVIAGAISMLADDFLYPIMNMKLVYLDDFPAPFPTGYNEKIHKELNLDIPTFFRNVWWPFIQKQAGKYDIKYTAVVIQTYNDVVTSPLPEDKDENIVRYGREILKMGGEIGIHGYNHQSLVTDQSMVSELDYHAWPSKENMVQSLQMVQEHIGTAFPGYQITTYVPPSNIIDKNGIEAIQDSLSQITNISAIYLTDADPNAFRQEYETNGNLVYLPRITSGHSFTQYDKWVIANVVTSLGVFSHFIHPDDILDEDRALGNSWGKLSKDLNNLFKDTSTKYPWLKSMTASEATTDVKNYEASDFFIKDEPYKKTGYINHFSGSMSFLLRTDKKIGITKGCHIEKIDKGVYHVQATEEIFEIGLK
jgi:hypothetical protein